MAMKQFRFVATALSLLLAGAVAEGAQLPQNVKTIGVIPVLPTSGHLYHVALLRFGNQCKPFELRGANLEAATYSAASSVLSRYKLVRLSTSICWSGRSRLTAIAWTFPGHTGSVSPSGVSARPWCMGTGG
jgi:hypothetical protein